MLPSQEPWRMLNEGMPDNYDRGLAVCFDTNGKYVGIRTLNRSSGVLYRPGPSSNSGPFTPSVKISDKLEKKVQWMFAATGELAGVPVSDDWKVWLDAIPFDDGNVVEQVAKDVLVEAKAAGIGEKLPSGKYRSGYLFTARFDNGAIQAVYELEAAKSLMVRQVIELWGRYCSKDGYCSVCGAGPKTVFGNYAVLACYNLDKPGSIAGGFKDEASVKNFPVCEDCAIRLAATIKFVQDYLTSFMAGQRYMILPYSSHPELRSQLTETLQSHPERFHLSQQCDLLAAEEDELFKYLQEVGSQDQLAFALVFFDGEPNSAAWRIQAEVQQVLPSRLRRLYEVRRQLAQDPVLYTLQRDRIQKTTDERPFNLTTMTLKALAGSELDSKTSGALLRAWLAAIFEGRTIERGPFLRQLVRHLLAVGRREPTKLGWATRQAWAVYRFARAIQLISQGENTMPINTPRSAYGAYVQEHRDFFGRSEVAVAFLTGCYASTVASVQRRERGADPFTKKFLGRLLNREHLQRLYQQGHDKLMQYGKLGFVATSLDPDLATAWVECGDKWVVNDEETTFAFTLGYSLAYRIRQLAGEDLPEEETAESN